MLLGMNSTVARAITHYNPSFHLKLILSLQEFDEIQEKNTIILFNKYMSC